MIRGIHYFSTELKTKIDVIPRSCFNKVTVCVHGVVTDQIDRANYVYLKLLPFMSRNFFVSSDQPSDRILLSVKSRRWIASAETSELHRGYFTIGAHRSFSLNDKEHEDSWRRSSEERGTCPDAAITHQIQDSKPMLIIVGTASTTLGQHWPASVYHLVFAGNGAQPGSSAPFNVSFLALRRREQATGPYILVIWPDAPDAWSIPQKVCARFK